MSEYIKRIRTTTGDKQIDYNALANLPTIPNYGTATQTTDGLMSASDKKKIDDGTLTEYKVADVDAFTACILQVFIDMPLMSHKMILLNLEQGDDAFGAGVWAVTLIKARDGFGTIYASYYWLPSTIKTCAVRSGEVTGWYKLVGTPES